MSVIVKLEAVVEAMDQPEEWEAFLHPETGEIITVTPEERSSFEDGDWDVEDLQDWERESFAQARRALESDKMLPLPDKFEIHEWDIMRRFSLAQEGAALRELEHAVHGSGAFRKFRAAINRLGLREAWFKYRDEAVKQIARDWLDSHGILYVERIAAQQSTEP
jgi:hypothetical protein